MTGGNGEKSSRDGTTDVLCGLGIGTGVVICCGRGNNGGDGFVVARHLDLRSHAVRVLVFDDPAGLRGDAALNFAVLEKSGVPIHRIAVDGLEGELSSQLSGAGWIVDALLGTGAAGEPRPPLDRIIDTINSQTAPVLAIDVPSGLDCDTGQAGDPTFRAAIMCATKHRLRVPCFAIAVSALSPPL